MARKPQCAVGPATAPTWYRKAVIAGGGDIVSIDRAEALIWHHSTADALGDALRTAGGGLRWISLPSAGIERYVPCLTDRYLWTAPKGAFAQPVAEMALALSLAVLRGVVGYARREEWSPAGGTNLRHERVTLVGGGGIASEFIRLIAPFHAEIAVVRKQVRPIAGAHHIYGPDRLHDALHGARLVVIAAALTPETAGLFARRRFEAMSPDAWLVNVARGGLVVTDDLVTALRDRQIAGAALDVTDPEPLPAGHPLWHLDNCVITPHTANTPDMYRHHLERYITENVMRFGRNEALDGQVDPNQGY